NSVVQYFPGAGYLTRVIAGAIRTLAPGGTLFLGDVRSLPLLSALHTALELGKAEPSLEIAELRRRVASQIANERELALSPRFFAALARQLPRIKYVEIRPKRGRSLNELTQFRYQVVIHLDHPCPPPPPATERRSWRAEQMTLGRLRALLGGGSAPALHLADVPN